MDFLMKAMDIANDEEKGQIVDATLDAARPKMEMTDSKLENTLRYCVGFVGSVQRLAAILTGYERHENVRSSLAFRTRQGWCITISHSDFWNTGGLWSPLGYPQYWAGWERPLSMDGGELEVQLLEALMKIRTSVHDEQIRHGYYRSGW